jgi:hypothetical protein
MLTSAIAIKPTITIGHKLVLHPSFSILIPVPPLLAFLTAELLPLTIGFEVSSALQAAHIRDLHGRHTSPFNDYHSTTKCIRVKSFRRQKAKIRYPIFPKLDQKPQET